LAVLRRPGVARAQSDRIGLGRPLDLGAFSHVEREWHDRQIVSSWRGRAGSNPRAERGYRVPGFENVLAFARGLTHLLNGRVISILIDEDTKRVPKSGIIGLEVEATGKLYTRNIWLKRLQ
jgi:hypothetical protein